MTRKRLRAASLLVYLLMGGGIAASLLAPLILFIELFEWLTSSEWPGLTLADGLGIFGIHHAGSETEAQRLLDVATALPLSAVLFLTGVSAFLTGVSLGDWRDERRLMAELDGASPFYWMTLVGAPDVRFPTLVRLLFLDLLLRFIAITGAVMLLLDAVLILVGAGFGWMAAGGLLLLFGAWLVERVEERKLERGAPARHAQR